MSAPERIGRNAPCPCGSGKKHKVCCALRKSDVTGEVRRSPWRAVGYVAGLLVVVAAGVVAAQLRGSGPTAKPESNPAPAPVPVPFPGTVGMPGSAQPAPLASGALTPQPPGAPPPGKVWSPEHGHWHDAPGVTTTPVVQTSDGTPVPMSAPTLTPQPPGDPPPGKVWSPEHGHWHDAPAAGAGPQ